MDQVRTASGRRPNIVLKHCPSGCHRANFSSHIVSNSVGPRLINNMFLGSIKASGRQIARVRMKELWPAVLMGRKKKAPQ